ncbi:MAG: GtrA family protein [Lysobacteraceae bacterium]
MRRGIIRSEFARFLAVGFTSVAIDFVSYRALLAFGIETAPAKACSFIIGAVFGYFANRIFTFRVEKHWEWQEAAKFIAVYLFALLANVAANACVIHVLGHGEIGIAIAFLVATAISATLNYLGMKRVVFIAAKDIGHAPQ